MPSKYTPTGKPAGRPKKVATPLDVRAVFGNPLVDRRSIPFANICPECFPKGWPDGQRTAGCSHGTWVKR